MTLGYSREMSRLYRFRLKTTWDEPSDYTTVGYMLPSVVSKMLWTDKFIVNNADREVLIAYIANADDGYETTAISEQLEKARESDSFKILCRWREQYYLILGIDRPVRMARNASALFGIHTVGVHMTGFVRDPRNGEMKLWIPRRAADKHTFPGMLDNTVAGGMTADEDAFLCILRKSQKEAALPEDYVRTHAKAVGTVSYFSVRHPRAGAESDLLQPATQLCYDIELPTHMTPQASDGEVDEFHLWSVAETMAAAKNGEFKPNSLVVLVDFFVRHGIITAQNEPDYQELVSRLHRRIRF